MLRETRASEEKKSARSEASWGRSRFERDEAYRRAAWAALDAYRAQVGPPSLARACRLYGVNSHFIRKLKNPSARQWQEAARRITEAHVPRVVELVQLYQTALSTRDGRCRRLLRRQTWRRLRVALDWLHRVDPEAYSSVPAVARDGTVRDRRSAAYRAYREAVMRRRSERLRGRKTAAKTASDGPKRAE